MSIKDNLLPSMLVERFARIEKQIKELAISLKEDLLDVRNDIISVRHNILSVRGDITDFRISRLMPNETADTIPVIPPNRLMPFQFEQKCNSAYSQQVVLSQSRNQNPVATDHERDAALWLDALNTSFDDSDSDFGTPLLSSINKISCGKF
jgi:hypothetical protein